MAGGKSLGMIRSLQAKERVAFREGIENKRNGNLVRLFDQLVACVEGKVEPTASELFVTIWEQEWEAEKDYLLRNELRHLNRFLKDFMASRTAANISSTDFSESLALLQELGARGEWKVFDAEFASHERKALETDDLISLAEGWRIYSQFLVVRAGLSERESQRALEKAKESMEWQRRAALRMQLLEWQKHEYFQRVVHSQQGLEYAGSEPPLNGYLPQSLGPTDQYLLAKGKYHATPPSLRLAHLQTVFSILQQCTGHGNLDLGQEFLWLDFAMGVEFYLARDYVASRASLERGIANPLFSEYPRRAAILFNYLATLLKAREYGTALEKMLLWDRELGDSEQMVDRYRCQKAMIYLFNGELDAALGTLQAYVSHTNSDTHMYYRILRSIVFFLRGDADTALNEIGNLLQITPMRRGEFPTYKSCAKFVERYLLLAANGTPPQSEGYAKLKADIFAPENKEVADMLLTQWISDLIVNY